MSATAPPSPLKELVGRYDADVADVPGGAARVRLDVRGGGAWDAVIGRRRAVLEPANGHHPDASLTADEQTWAAIARDVRGGMQAFRTGRLTVRHNLHLGVGFLAATSGMTEPGRLRFTTLDTAAGRISTAQAGMGPTVVAIHGLGATKASFLPTLEALADGFRVVAIDLPGFGDSDKPLGAPYHAPFFAAAVVAVLDALGEDRAHLVGNSLGGRVALEVGLRNPDRVRRLGLLAPSLAWRRPRRWAGALKLVRPELGLLPHTPRRVVQGIVERVVPGATDGWTAAGIDEFMRAFLTSRGRAAFYATARQIYLEEPEGERGFWPRLATLQPDALFVWGRQDRLVPIAFARHVSDATPHAQHLELDCGHVPQLERPRETHRALAEFLGAG
ncbi:MAG: alpha/beta fold hydrolase [Solirubrobacteraceae bacterium]